MSNYLQFQADKAVSDSLDYTVNFIGWLNDSPGDQIAAAAVVAVPNDITISNVNFGNGLVIFYASGGTAGQIYKFNVTITTTNNRNFTQPVFLKMSK